MTSRPTLAPTQPSIQTVPGVKRQGREAEHSFVSCEDVKNGGAIAPLPLRLHGWYLITEAQK
jgi:hypothetical protein